MSPNGVVRQVAGRLQRLTCPLCNLLALFRACNDCTSYAGLHNAIFHATCLTMLEKEIHCKLQKTCYTLQPRAATCNVSRKVLAENRTVLYFVQSLPSQKSCATSFKEGMLHFITYLQLFSQHHCDASCKEKRKLHHVTLAVQLGSQYFLQRLQRL